MTPRSGFKRVAVWLRRRSLRWRRGTGSRHDVLPFAVLAIAVLCFILLPQYSSATLSTRNAYNILQIFAEYGLLALALGMTMIAGEYDLSTASMYGLAGMVAVLSGAGSPLLGVIAALGVGLIAGLIQGAIIARLRMSSIPVALGGFIIFLGITYVISNNREVPYNHISTALTIDEPIGGIFSIYSLVTIVVFVLLAVLLFFTRLGPEVRAVGGDRDSSRSAGVKVSRVLVLLFGFSGLAAAGCGALHAYSVSAALPELGFAPLIFATIAALLGGVSLAGGRGSVLGIGAGLLTLAILQEVLTMLSEPEYVADLVTGGVLLIVTVVAAPGVADWWHRRRSSTRVITAEGRDGIPGDVAS